MARPISTNDDLSAADVSGLYLLQSSRFDDDGATWFGRAAEGLCKSFAFAFRSRYVLAEKRVKDHLEISLRQPIYYALCGRGETGRRAAVKGLLMGVLLSGERDRVGSSPIARTGNC